MRKLCFMDAFALARIIKAADLKKEIVAFATEIAARKQAAEANGISLDVESVGFEFLFTIISAAGNPVVEEQIYKFYANLKGAKPEEVKTYDFDTIKADIAVLVKENNLADFFHSASSLISKA